MLIKINSDYSGLDLKIQIKIKQRFLSWVAVGFGLQISIVHVRSENMKKLQ